MGDFYGTGIEIWARFRPIGHTEKKSVWANYEQLLRVLFSCFQGQKNVEFFLNNFSVRTKKLHK